MIFRFLEDFQLKVHQFLAQFLLSSNVMEWFYLIQK